MNIVQSLLVIFTIISVGIVCEKRKLFNQIQIEGFEIFLFKIAIPCYLFSSIFQHDLVTLFYPQYIYAYVTSFAFVSVTVVCFCRKEKLSAILLKVMASGYVSAAIYTLPVITFLLKDPIAGVLGNIIQVILLQPIFITALSFMTHKEKSIFEKIVASLLSPLVYMPIIGLLCNYLQFFPPEFITKTIQNIGNGASSIALLVFGLSLGSIKIVKKDITRELLLMSTIKSLIHPIFAFYVGKYLFALEGYWLNSLVISASAPTAFSVYLIAKQFSVEQDLVKKAVALSSIASLVLLAVIMLILR